MLEGKSLKELLRLYLDILRELRRRELIRDGNGPAGGIAEMLVSRALDLTLATNANQGLDALGKDGTRFQIKARVLARTNGPRQMGAIRGLEKNQFDFLACVIFDRNFEIFRAVLIPHSLVTKHAKHQTHVNAARFMLKDSILEDPEVEDITQKLRNVFRAL